MPQKLTTSTLPRAIIKWPGGKGRLAKHLMPLIQPHVCYCEPFCGGLGLFVQKDRSKVEVINDLNGDLVNLYRVVKYHAGELAREFDGLINSRVMMRDFISQPGLTDIQRAARWLYRNALSFGANMHSWGVQRLSSTGGGSTSLPRMLQGVEALNTRLQGVNIENLDWQRCVEIYDSPKTFFFFDPPYSNCKQDNYKTWGREHLESLRNTVKRIRGDFLLTVNDCVENRELFKQFKQRVLKRQRGISNKAGSDAKQYAELVIFRSL